MKLLKAGLVAGWQRLSWQGGGWGRVPVPTKDGLKRTGSAPGDPLVVDLRISQSVRFRSFCSPAVTFTLLEAHA